MLLDLGLKQIDEQIARAWPVGSVFISVVATDPAVLLGIGTWQAIGAGRVLVGHDVGDADFDTLEETGGAKMVTLTGAQSGVAAHAHAVTDPGHVHTQRYNQATTGALSGPTTAPDTSSNNVTNYGVTTASAITGLTVNNASAANAVQSHGNVQPYLVVRFWKRTA